MQHSSLESVCTALSCLNMVSNRNEQKVIKLKQNWVIVNEGITNVKNLVEDRPESAFTPLDYMMLYSTIFNMACEKRPYECSQQLYGRYREAYDEYITSKVLPALRKKHDEIMLKELVRRWENHKLMVRYLSQSFGYLDRYFICRSNLPTLKDVGFRSFCDLVYPLLAGSIQWKKNGNLTEVVDYEDGAMKEAVISMIDREREGEQVDRGLARNALDIVAEIGVGKMDYYQDYVEPFVLEHTRVYYSRKASKWISEDRIHDYMLKVEVCLKREKNIVSHYLHFSSEQEILEIVQRELLSVNATKLLEKDDSYCLALFRNDKVDDLSRMYRLFSKIPGGLDHVSSTFKQHVTAEGIALVKQAEDAASIKKVFVGKVIELYDKYSSYVEDYFMNHSLFCKAFNEACETICNKAVAGSSSAELLATFCNDTLRNGGSERLSNDDIEKTLEKVVKVLSYNNEKYLFAEFYRRKLGGRLLLTVNADSELEKSFLKKLKRQFGVEFTSKMELMFTDLTSAREKQSFFEEYLSLSSNPRISLGLDFSVTVLTGHLWQSCKPCDLILPKEMVECVQVFEDFYKTQTKDRKLSWIYSLGTCNINGKFKAKTVELIVTTYQASVLLLFNSSDRLSYQEIMTRLNLSEDDVGRLLHSLSCVKYKILLKQPNTKTISPTDYFEFNSKFTDIRRRIKIPLPPMDEKKKVMADVDQDRRYAIDASIVRIMKWRKKLRNQDLVAECVKQMGHLFKPEEKIIQKRIEALIDREFLERDGEVRGLLRYVA